MSPKFCDALFKIEVFIVKLKISSRNSSSFHSLFWKWEKFCIIRTKKNRSSFSQSFKKPCKFCNTIFNCVYDRMGNFESNYTNLLFFFIPFVVLEMGKILYHQNKEESSSFSQSFKKSYKFCTFELFIIVFMIKWEISNYTNLFYFSSFHSSF